ncbi:MAG: hypothetical protein LV481_01920 [Methylacidiphilales bacterium]|nr:hypothetical protein [Candidatus Methylacidiphilales bacterium]
MKEKIYEFNIEHPLTAPRRKALDQFLKKNAPRSKWPTSHEWDRGNDHLLHVTTHPVKWEVWFAPHRVTIFGSAPFWAKMLFSNKKRALLRESFLHILQQTGFTKDRTPSKRAKSGHEPHHQT